MLDAMGERASFILEPVMAALPLRLRRRGPSREDIPTASLEFLPSEGGYDLRLSKEVLVVRGLEVAFVLADGIAARIMAAYAPAFSFLQDAGLAAGQRAFIAEHDAEAFCRRALPVLEETLSVELPEAWEALRPVAGTLAFYFDVTEKEAALIRLTVKAFYGEREVVLESPADSAEEPELRPASSQAFRDQDLEDAGVAVAAQFFDGSCTLPLRQTELAGELLYGGLAQFRAVGEVFTTPAFDRLIMERPPRVSLGLSLRANLIQMDVRESDLRRRAERAMLSAYRRRRRFHRLSDGRIAALGEGDVAVLGDMMRDLGVSADALLDGGAELPTYQAFYLDREYGDAVRDRAFEDYRVVWTGRPRWRRRPLPLRVRCGPTRWRASAGWRVWHRSVSAASWPMRWVSARRCR